jgi:hypothetical protein
MIKKIEIKKKRIRFDRNKLKKDEIVKIINKKPS